MANAEYNRVMGALKASPTLTEPSIIMLSFEATMLGKAVPLLHKGKVADAVPELPKKIFGEGKARYPESVRKIYGEGSPKVFVPNAMNFVVHLEGAEENPGISDLYANMYLRTVKAHFQFAGFYGLETFINPTEKGLDIEMKVALDSEGLERAACEPTHSGALRNKRLIETGKSLAAKLLPQG